jgi:hypothetical protein
MCYQLRFSPHSRNKGNVARSPGLSNEHFRRRSQFTTHARAYSVQSSYGDTDSAVTSYGLPEMTATSPSFSRGGNSENYPLPALGFIDSFTWPANKKRTLVGFCCSTNSVVSSAQSSVVLRDSNSLRSAGALVSCAK